MPYCKSIHLASNKYDVSNEAFSRHNIFRRSSHCTNRIEMFDCKSTTDVCTVCNTVQTLTFKDLVDSEIQTVG